MDIEEIAAKEPEALIQVVVEPAVGLQQFQAREIAAEQGVVVEGHLGVERQNPVVLGDDERVDLQHGAVAVAERPQGA
jgi:hypothetical protein